MPLIRRRTRSRRSTRRLHRTHRRRRLQRGGASRQELSAWRSLATPRLERLRLKIEEGRGGVDLLEELKTPELTLTEETAPVLTESGRSNSRTETYVSLDQNTQTLMTAAANIVERIGIAPFKTVSAFESFAQGLSSTPDQDQKPTYEFLSNLEATLRGDPAVGYVKIEDKDTHPLFIWAAVANIDYEKAESFTVPLLLPTEEAPAPPAE